MRGRFILQLTGGRAPAAEGAARAAPNDGADARTIAVEGGIAERQSALTGPAEEPIAEALVGKVGGDVDPIGHD